MRAVASPSHNTARHGTARYDYCTATARVRLWHGYSTGYATTTASARSTPILTHTARQTTTTSKSVYDTATAAHRARNQQCDGVGSGSAQFCTVHDPDSGHPKAAGDGQQVGKGFTWLPRSRSAPRSAVRRRPAAGGQAPFTRQSRAPQVGSAHRRRTHGGGVKNNRREWKGWPGKRRRGCETAHRLGAINATRRAF